VSADQKRVDVTYGHSSVTKLTKYRKIGLDWARFGQWHW